MNDGPKVKSSMYPEAAKVCNTNEREAAIVPATSNVALLSDGGGSGVLQADGLRTSAMPRNPKTETNKTEHKQMPVGNRLSKTVPTSKNIPYYLTAAGIFISLKFGFKLADNNDLIFLLEPTNKLVGLLTGSHSAYLPDDGFYHDKLNILIDKSCSGFNFLILCFLVFTYSGVKHSDKSLHKILTVPTALLAAYPLTIFVTASRIFVSVVVQNQTRFFLTSLQHLIHEAVGVITNLSFLVLSYYLIEKFLINRRHNAKLA